MALNYAVQLSMIDRMTAPLKGLTQQWQRTGEAIKQVDKQTASFDRARDVSGLFTNMGGMDSTLIRSANLTVVGAGAVSLGKRISNALQEPLDVAMEFEATLSKVQALTRLDTNDNAQRAKLDALREQAKLLGDTTSFSASQAADAQSFLAMAGFDPDKIMASMPGMLSLAKAGGTELARTADIASNVLSGFGMAANQMTRLSDVMAYTFSSSNVNMEMLGETMKYVAPVASKAGASLEQVAAMSGMLGDVGIQGSMAGTALRAAFIRMADPPKEAAKALKALGVSAKDNRGNMREVTDVMLDLNRSMGKLPDGKRLEYVSSIFGQEAAAAMMELVSNADKLDSRFKEIDRSAGGAADRIAKVMGQNLKGQKDEMLSALEGLYITIGDMLIPIVSKGYGKITGFIRRIQGWINKNKDLAQTIVQLGSQLGGAVMMFGVTAMALASVTTAATGLKLGLQSVLPHLSILRVAGGLAFAGLIYGVYQADRVLPILSQHFPMLGNWLEQRLPAAVQRFKNAWSIFKGMQAGDQQFASLSTLKKTQILLQTTFGLTPFILFDQLLDRVQAHWQRLYTQLSAQLPVL
ncbi:phage tail tape measure protein, partial [Candidatus Dojkabacteria bacterium]